MKNLSILLLLSSLLLLSCGKDKKDKSSSSPSFKYSFCGTVQSSGQQMQLLTNSGTYNLTFENNNQTLMNQLYQHANSGQQTCVYSNQEAQSTGSSGGFTGYTLPNITVQQVGGGNTTGTQGNYSVSLCGMIYKANSYGGNYGQTIYMVQVSTGQTGVVSQYQIQASNNTVSGILNQIQGPQQNGCVYANQQPSQMNTGLIVIAEQVVLQ